MNRLEFLASLTKNSNSVLDIGSDHAYTVVYAVRDFGVKKATAADINIGPLKNAVENIRSFKLEDKIDTCLSNGFSNIESSYDTVVISGMGGKLIRDILDNSKEKLPNFSKFILQPNSDMIVLREYLMNNNMLIVDEHLILDKKKFYVIIECIKGNMNLSEDELFYGPILLKKRDPLFIEMYTRKLNMLEKNLARTNADSKTELVKKINRIRNMIDTI